MLFDCADVCVSPPGRERQGYFVQDKIHTLHPQINKEAGTGKNEQIVKQTTTKKKQVEIGRK